MWEMSLAAHSGNTSASGACQSIEYWGWDDTNRSGPPMSIPARICSGVHSLNPEVAGLPRLDHLLQRFDGVLDRHVGVEPVCLIQVDVVGAQAAQRGVDLLGDLLAERPRSVSDILPHTLVAST